MEKVQALNKNLENQNQLNQEEIKLLRDYVYGIDTRAKDVHNHKFGLKAG